MPGAVAYNPSDPTQAAFLAALQQGETGTVGPSTLYEGTGGVNLAGAPADQYGFPQWSGFGSSHAAGEYQFQPATWDAVASQHNLNFGNPSDQNAAAWYLAQDTYAQQTGGSLQDALQSGNFSSVQSALSSVWPSVTGNGASPGGLASAITGFLKNGVPGFGGGSSGSSSQGSSGGGILGAIENFFVRFGLIIIGGIIVIAALWKLLSDQGVVPSPGDMAKSVAKVAAVAA